MGHDIEVTTFEGSTVMELADVKQHINAIQSVMRGAMKRGVHYGIIPGTKGGPSLWKPGAELIFTMFRLGTKPTIEETGDGYRVTIEVFHIPTGQVVGYGMGSCSWGEDKYAWKKAMPGEWDQAEVENRRIKHGRDCMVQQVRTNPCDLQNTVLKMAVKRARVDACLTTTAASDVFEQDMAPENGGGGDGRNGAETAHDGAQVAHERRTGGASDEPLEVDDAKLLLAIETAINADELIVVFDAINALKSAKQKVGLMGPYRARLQELGPDAVTE